MTVKSTIVTNYDDKSTIIKNIAIVKSTTIKIRTMKFAIVSNYNDQTCNC